MNTIWLSKINSIGDMWADWMVSHGPKLLISIIAVYLISQFVSFSLRKIIYKVSGRNQTSGEHDGKQRAKTLTAVFDGMISLIFWIVIFLITLDQFGVNIGPILATAGVVGIAIGLGSQYLIRDLISGFFIIIENHYRVGDMICVGTNCGFVESINLRLTKLRDQDGTVYHIPNGEIRISSNQSRIFSYCTLTMGIAYETDCDKAIEVINRVGAALAEDPEWKKSIVTAPRFLRIENFTDLAMIVKIQGATKPSTQPGVVAELRKRLKRAFEEEGIVMPHNKP